MSLQSQQVPALPRLTTSPPRSHFPPTLHGDAGCDLQAEMLQKPMWFENQREDTSRKRGHGHTAAALK